MTMRRPSILARAFVAVIVALWLGLGFAMPFTPWTSRAALFAGALVLGAALAAPFGPKR